jgi:3-hydroxyacyl-[acyl-carrier-protein] dehydratase
MPPTQLFDLSKIDLDQVLFDREEIKKDNPQDLEMQQLDGIIWYDKDNFLSLGYKDVTEDEFWVRGHIPERPLMPGVIMVEAAAQISSFAVKRIYGFEGFIGFAGIDNAKFRRPVEPGKRLYLLCYIKVFKRRKFTAVVQGIVDDAMVFDCQVSGLNV